MRLGSLNHDVLVGSASAFTTVAWSTGNVLVRNVGLRAFLDRRLQCCSLRRTCDL